MKMILTADANTGDLEARLAEVGIFHLVFGRGRHDGRPEDVRIGFGPDACSCV